MTEDLGLAFRFRAQGARVPSEHIMMMHGSTKLSTMVQSFVLVVDLQYYSRQRLYGTCAPPVVPPQYKI